MMTKHIKLPLAYSSHRQILDADRNLVIEVLSGGPGIEAADELQQLVVKAVNSHEQLVEALKAVMESLRQPYDGGDGMPLLALVSINAQRKALAALAAVGA
jgi:hypothetical protein